MTEHSDAAGVYQLSERKEGPTSNRMTGGLDALWRWLTDYRLLIAVVVLTLAFILVAFLLPQMPDRLQADPGESTRWLVTTAARYGAFGDLLGQFGFFNVLQSPLLKLALTIIALLLMIHLAELIGAAWQLRNLSGALTQPGGAAGEPLPLPRGRRVVRLRTSVITDADVDSAEDHAQSDVQADAESNVIAYPTVDALTDTLALRMATDIGEVARHTVDIAPSPTVAAIVDDAPPVTETRLLAVRNLTAAYLRPLLMLGLLLLLAAAWLLINFGWALTVSSLTPGKMERFAAQNVELRYDVLSDAGASADGATPVLTITVGDEEAQLDVSDGARAKVNGVNVNAYSTAPGLLLRTASGQPLLTLPGQSTPSQAIGLIFPSVGSEEIVLLERQSAGLRIVRIGDPDADFAEDSPLEGPNNDNAFMVEIYRSITAAPDQRIDIGKQASEIIEFDQGQFVELLPVDGVGAQLRHTPGSWLVWPALALVLVGVYGFWRKPTFVLTQIAPWTDAKAVVVAQSDLSSELDAIALELIAADRRE